MADAKKDMSHPLRSLYRRAEPRMPAEVRGDETIKEKLLNSLSASISNKKQYNNVFATPESVKKWAGHHKLDDSMLRILLAMQESKDIFVNVAWLDALLTFLFFLEAIYVSWDMYMKGLLVVFVCLLLLTDAVICRVKGLSTTVGLWLSDSLHRLRLVDSSPLAGKVQLKKWTGQSWQLFVHVLFAAWEGYLLTEEPWYASPPTNWIPHPYDQQHRTDLVVFYMAQLSIWIYTCIVHRFFDERRKDYFILYLHHIVTIMLVAGSFSAGYLRIGLCVLWVHDMSDVFVDLLKMVNYLKLEGTKGFFASELAYFSCVIAWIYWRLYQYPFRVLRGAIVDCFYMLAPQPRIDDGVFGMFMFDLPLWVEMVFLLILLLVLHVYWGILLLRVGYRILTESARDASRGEYEGDSDDETMADDDDNDAVVPSTPVAPAEVNGKKSTAALTPASKAGKSAHK